MVIPYNKVRISGTMPGGEVWSINPAFGNQAGLAVDDFEDLQDWADRLADDTLLPLFRDSFIETMSSAVRITQIRTEYYDATGKLADVAETALNPARTSPNTPNKPFQSAIAMSLRTARPGRSFRGRLYWPALNAELNAASLRLAPALTQALAEDCVQMLNQIAAESQLGLAYVPVVVSQTLGINSPITRVEVGDILDTQRRRRDAVVEAYSSYPISV